MKPRRWATRMVAAVALPVLLVLVGCTGGKGRGNGLPAVVRPAMQFNLAPSTGAKNLPASTEIGTTVANGKVTSVTLVDSTQKSVPGSFRPDGSSWVPATPLAFDRTYTATVTATSPDGRSETRTTTFSTMKKPGPNRIGTGLYFQNGATYGVGMPVAIEFDSDIPDSAKAAVERRLFVTSNPPQVGAWRWYGDRQVLYRPERYWQPGTKLTVRAALDGLPVGRRYLDQDRGGTAKIGRKQTFVVKNSTKRLYVYQDDNLVRTFKESAGKPSTPTGSGNLVIMSREYSTLFSTPEYRITAYYAERLTWGGVYFHSAPWSVGEQGYTNVSHGCINLSEANAAWVYNVSQVGDPVTISGTEVHISPGDGWTVWDMSWDEYKKGSALR
jgi:lipoprotein-anchoring transpeptidase ErfK/SrfK